jgi:four helix bundle protein
VASIKKFSDLSVWQKAHKFVLAVYKVSEQFPKSELFGLTNQLRRASVSITSNIVEGFERNSNKEMKQFFTIARASLAEAQSQLLIARDLGFMRIEQFNKLAEQSVEIHKMINGFIKSLDTRKLETSKLIKTGGF